MNINKRLDRVKQWAGEKMGAESKTNVSEEFKALEMEMALRHDGRIPFLTSANRQSSNFGQVWRNYRDL